MLSMLRCNARTLMERLPSRFFLESLASLILFADIRPAIASACTKSIFLDKNARFVNSPGSATLML